MVRKETNQIHKKVTILERGPSNMVTERESIQLFTPSMYHITLLGKIFSLTQLFQNKNLYH